MSLRHHRPATVVLHTPTPWFVIVVMAAAMVLLAYGSRYLTHSARADWSWTGLYVVGAAGLVAWRATFRRPFLVVWGSILFGVSFFRAVYLAIIEDDISTQGRATGIGVSMLLMAFAWKFTVVQSRWECQAGEC